MRALVCRHPQGRSHREGPAVLVHRVWTAWGGSSAMDIAARGGWEQLWTSHLLEDQGGPKASYLTQKEQEVLTQPHEPTGSGPYPPLQSFPPTR